ncbi:unnamed protein product [Effrenium voratum]|uniref:SMP-LTD domain-containing protein n=1 Tax=Effrenium voratum TaxID=2562239 RepID=A0AA36NKC8_9DINO|nr:unnamed protein product [Effrenium voratum]
MFATDGGFVLVLGLVGSVARSSMEEICVAVSRASQEAWFFSAACAVASLGFGGRHLGPQCLDLCGGTPPQRLRPLLLLLAQLPLLLAAAAQSAAWSEARSLKWALAAQGLGFSLFGSFPEDASWAHGTPASGGSVLSGTAVGRALLLHLALAAVPFLAAAVSSCCVKPTARFVVLALLGAAFLADRLAAKAAPLGLRWAALADFAAALLCLNFPELRRFPRLSEWAEGYAGLRAASSQKKTGRQQRRADIVGGLRRLSARLLKHPLPEVEEAQDPAFLNCLLVELWPSLRGMLEEDVLKGEVQAVLQESVTGALKFDSVFLGAEPPRAHLMKLVPGNRSERSITLVVDAEFVGKEVDITLKLTLGSFMGLSVSVRRLSMRGTLHLAFRHLTPHLPISQGLTIAFANPPLLDLELCSSSAVAFLPERAREALISLISSSLAREMVLPNRLPLPFGTLWPLDRLQHCRPEGVLACRVLGACGVPPERGKFGFERPSVCALQLGASIWRSRAALSEEGDFLWDEQPFLVVDSFEDQSLLVALQERHTFNDQTAAHQAIPLAELVERSQWQHMPSWALQASRDMTPQLLLSGAFHPVTRKRGGFVPELGSLLLVTVDCARNLPKELEDHRLMVRLFLMPQRRGRPDAQSCSMFCSRVPPVQAGQAMVDRLLMCNFDQTAQAVQISADSSEEEVDVKKSWESYVESEEARWRERLQLLWSSFRSAEFRDLGDWLEVDREGCIRSLAVILDLPVWCEQRLGRLLEELATPSRARGRSKAKAPAAKRPLECHWRQQLRLVTRSPLEEELLLEICHVHRRAEPEVVGVWQTPLRSLLSAQHMTDPMAPRPLRSPKDSATQAGADGFTIHLKLELLHLRPREEEAEKKLGTCSGLMCLAAARGARRPRIRRLDVAWHREVLKRQYVATVERQWYQEIAKIGIDQQRSQPNGTSSLPGEL